MNAHKDYPGKGKVALLSSSPQTVLDDYARLLDLAGYQEALPADKKTILKVNLSSETWYPAASTPPWQLEGVIRKLQGDGYERLYAVQNRAAAVDAYRGEQNNKQKSVVNSLGVKNVHLYEPQSKWEIYKPKLPFLVLDEIFPAGIPIPELFIGQNMVHLPTLKTHTFVTIAGAMENGLNSLPMAQRRLALSHLHEALVDLLSIQQDIHSGLFAVMDGTFAGDGAGPQALRWHEKNIILASADLVALDAIAAKLQGFDPLEIPFIRIAHEMGLGVGDAAEIELVGEEKALLDESWGFMVQDTPISQGEKVIYQGSLQFLEPLLLHSPLAAALNLAEDFYFNAYWLPFVGKRRVEGALRTKWGQHFAEYGDGAVVLPGVKPKPVVTVAALVGLGLLSVLLSKGKEES